MEKELKQLEEALTQIQKYQMDEPDHEGEMAKSQMLKTMKYAADIMNTIDDSTNLPAWVQSKLTKIADYIGAVKHYMDSKTVRHIVTNMGEGVERKSEEIRLVDMVPVNSRRESVKESVNERKMNRKSAQRIKLFGYEPIFKEIDFAKKDLKRQGYSNSKAQEFLFNFYGDEDPKIVQKIKESVVNETVSKTYKIPTQRGTLHIEVEEDPAGVFVDVIFNRVDLTTTDIQFPTGEVNVTQRQKRVKLKESVNEAS